ncbi:MAG: 3'-5' exonuclease, partial [Campylobacterota bacterium]|nr:3'-5' exonuclease [Campylobacterota bacterium]
MLIFLDLETTGLESEDKICSIAVVVVEGEKTYHKYELINEGKKIPAEASSIHHITNEMIKESSAFKESETFAFLNKNNTQEN